MRQADSQAEIDFPLGRKIQIDSGKNLVLLLANGIEARNRPEGAVVFDATGDFPGEIVAEFEVGRKDHPLMDTRAVEGTVQSRVEGEIPAAELFIKDGTNFPGPSVGGISAALPSDFVGNAEANRPVPFGRDAHARADVAADVVPAVALLQGSENV